MKDTVEKKEYKDSPNLSPFNWEDPLLFESQLSEDERMFRDSSKVFAQKVLVPVVTEAYEKEKFEVGLFKEMGTMGLLGLTIPVEYGGLGANYVSYGLVAREIERIDSGYRSMISVQSSLVMYPIMTFGS